MAGRPRGTFALSEWEMDELAYYHRGGWTEWQLAHYYGVCEKTVQRILRRMGATEPLRAYRSHATTEND